jgi:hypothetical protein
MVAVPGLPGQDLPGLLRHDHDHDPAVDGELGVLERLSLPFRVTATAIAENARRRCR